MRKHNHNHSCTCDHSEVKFCKHCQTVYCSGCNQEWTTKPTYNYGWYGQYTNTLANLYKGSGTPNVQTGTQDTLNETKCSAHGAQ